VLDVGTAIIWVAALSFLGFGAQPPLADWGSLISDGRSLLVSAPWVPLLPGLVVALTVFSLNHISKSIEEAGA
jgi:peptide/nickel transport system permease protein